MKKIAVLFLTFLLCTMCCACNNDNSTKQSETSISDSENNEYVNLTVSNEDCVGKDYERIKSDLVKLGLNNIECIAVSELDLIDKNRVNEVEKITLNGMESFSNGEQVKRDSEVIIYYYDLKNIIYPYASDEFEHVTPEEVKDKLKEIGFENIEIKEISDLNPDEFKDEYYNQVVLQDNTVINKGDSIKIDSKITINSHSTYLLYNVNFDIEFIANWFFDKYNVNVIIDDEEYCTLNHGQNANWTLKFQEGKHKLVFKSSSDESINNTLSIDVDADIDIGYKLSCHTDSIELTEKYFDRKEELEPNQVKIKNTNSSFYDKNYKDVIATLKDAGFTNIKENPLYDIIWGITAEGSVETVSINNKTDYKYGAVFDKSSEVVVTYHLKQENDPNKKQDTSTSSNTNNNDDNVIKETSYEMAKRAVIVAMTNCQATDVFESDGYTYDVSKFHSYDDLSSFYLELVSEGNWNTQSESSWQVKDMKLCISGSDTYIKVSANVSLNEDVYTVDDVDQFIGNKNYIDSNDDARINKEHFSVSDNNPFLNVPLELMSNNRGKVQDNNGDSSPEDDHTKWIENQMDLWDGSHKELAKLVKEKLSGGKSFRFEKFEFIDVDNEEKAEVVDNVLTKVDSEYKSEIGDLYVIQKFTVKVNNKTVSMTAYGWVKKSDNSTTLLFLE
ncbi:hypothetical protein [Ruminococcus sp. HUN007]|uniref:hypothetical protein n=1 Tax=Ruminococcus sp. HUN007 TaxID=1514668 RepID=UPI0005D13A19|nr:hypothetical protein [Ruminococcus sp. HUN007]